MPSPGVPSGSCYQLAATMLVGGRTEGVRVRARYELELFYVFTGSHHPVSG